MNKAYKDYAELNLTDDFMFCKVMTNHPDLCQELLEIILDVKIKQVVFLSKQESIEITSDGKGVRLDVYLEDDQNTVYDIEMQTTPQKDLPKRSRYYQGMIDLNLIERGAQYNDLKKSIIIFICLQDPFGKGLYAYHFSNKCKEMPSLELEDDTLKVFLNAAGTSGNISQELEEFLHYLMQNQGKGEFINKLDAAVQKARVHEEWRLEYMTLLQRDRQNHEEGRIEGLAEGRAEGLAEGRAEGRAEGLTAGRTEERKENVWGMYQKAIPLDVIADIVHLSVDDVRSIIQEMGGTNTN